MQMLSHEQSRRTHITDSPPPKFPSNGTLRQASTCSTGIQPARALPTPHHGLPRRSSAHCLEIIIYLRYFMHMHSFPDFIKKRGHCINLLLISTLTLRRQELVRHISKKYICSVSAMPTHNLIIPLICRLSLLHRDCSSWRFFF